MTEIPLSFGQQLLRFFNLYRPGSTRRAAFNVVGRYRLRGPLDLAALDQAVREVVRRHDILRTVVTYGDGVPYQHVVDAEPSPLDVRSLAMDDADAFFDEVESARFDLDRPPLFRAFLARVADDDHLLGLACHHSVSDNWSMAVLLRDLAALYTSTVKGDEPPPAPRQYAELAVWQEEGRDGPTDADLDFWADRLEDLPTTMLPCDRPRPSGSVGERALYRVELTPDESEQVLRCSRKVRSTAFMATLAAYLWGLAEITGERDVLVPVVTNGRHHRWCQDMLGFFVDALAIRTELAEHLTPLEVLENVRNACLDSYEHQLVPIVRIFEHAPDFAMLLADRDYALTCFQFLELPAGLGRTTSFGDVDCELFVRAGHGRQQAELTLLLDGLTTGAVLPDGRLVVDFVYSPELYDESTIARFGDRIREFLLSLDSGVAPARMEEGP